MNICESCYEAVCNTMPVDRETAIMVVEMGMGTEISDHYCDSKKCACTCGNFHE